VRQTKIVSVAYKEALNEVKHVFVTDVRSISLPLS